MTTFISFAVSVIPMSNNSYFMQYHFNIIPSTYNSNIVGVACVINGIYNDSSAVTYAVDITDLEITSVLL